VNRGRLALAGVVALAFAVRLAYLLEAQSLPLFHATISDARAYWEWSDRIAGGDWLGDTVFYQAPLYPYFLALLKLAPGTDLWSVRLIQIALGSLACGVLLLAGREFVSHRAGVAAGVLLALYPPAIFLDGLIQKASLSLLWMALLLWALARAQRTAGCLRLGGCGALLGLLMLTREETLLLAPVLALWMLLGLRAFPLAQRARGLAAFLLGLGLVLAPVVLRNARVGGEFVLTTAQAGPNFYIGNGPQAKGFYVPLLPGRGDPIFEREDAVALAEAARGRPLTSQEVSSYWIEATLLHIRAHPGEWLKLMLRKLRLLLNWYEVPDAEDQYFFERESNVLRGLGHLLHFGVLLPLAAAGVLLESARRRQLAVLYLVLATTAAGLLAFYLMARYRYPLVPGLALLAGAALAAGFERARAGRWRELLPAGAVALALVPICNHTLYARDFQLAQSLHNQGAALTAMKRPAEAVLEFRAALRLHPEMAETWEELGATLRSQQRLDEALEAFQQARQLQPESWRPAWRVGAVWLEKREFERARRLLASASEMPGAGPEAFRALASASQNSGHFREALAAWRRALALDPADPDTRMQLAFLLATCPDPSLRDGAEALALAQQVARVRPDDVAALDALAAAQAEQGQWNEALATIGRALAIAEQKQIPERGALRERERRYARQQPYRPGG
jgi:tetratricopeptide (TPR) repeat protein